ncbi:prolyl 3-hydroxylase OGFOD1-like [Mercenaria mercenaria]|uniref:prolyl 3-hydroxylase OGFOD1-like n=1 Tax=Mercenaria mercenaria TaxID=6596 RepID=UPI00234EDC12|nr:prolyl 3-hydroxylase OGFOD1-like [Mercenaria mercenaria]
MSGKRKSSLSPSDVDSKTPKVTCNQQILSEKLTSKSCISKLRDAWQETKNLTYTDDASGVEISHGPFRHCVLPNFLKDEEAISKLQDELMDLEFSEKNNDLYKFHQSTEDLKTAKTENIMAFRRMLCETFRDWLIQVTGIPLNKTVDAFCAQYVYTDTLLCHDDELEGRRIAYIFYLVNSWTEKDGGALDLFSVDDNIQPKEVVKSILPVRNNFVFFEVTPGSYHQVAEVLSEDKTRLSVSGWFHGPPIQRPPPYIEKPRQLHGYSSIDDDVFFDWINPVYLSVGAQGSIQEKFENESEIELQDFLQKEKYEALLEVLKSSNMCWKKMGPANKRCYNHADETCLPEVVQTCVNLFRSDAMFLLLSNMSGLKLHELAGGSSESESEADSEGSSQDAQGSSSSKSQTKEVEHEETTDSTADSDAASKKGNKESGCTARCRTEVRHWSHQCYTLIHDTDTEGSQFALDMVLYLGCQDWDMEYGGFTSYIAKGEDEELLTVTPQPNSLALVYRDQETLRFVKYLNTDINKMPNKGFYDIAAVYYE